jgi:hypothetical protein
MEKMTFPICKLALLQNGGVWWSALPPRPRAAIRLPLPAEWRSVQWVQVKISVNSTMVLNI